MGDDDPAVREYIHTSISGFVAEELNRVRVRASLLSGDPVLGVWLSHAGGNARMHLDLSTGQLGYRFGLNTIGGRLTVRDEGAGVYLLTYQFEAAGTGGTIEVRPADEVSVGNGGGVARTGSAAVEVLPLQAYIR